MLADDHCVTRFSDLRVSDRFVDEYGDEGWGTITSTTQRTYVCTKISDTQAIRLADGFVRDMKERLGRGVRPIYF